jgi:hypothetical protein
MNDPGKEVLFVGKAAEEMSREELIKCALHFRDAQLKSTLQQADMLRRMAKLERER